MNRLVTLGCTLALAALPLMGCGNDNINTCREYVSKANTAVDQCGGEPIYDADVTCPDTLADGPDCSMYYMCLGDGYVCDTTTQMLTVDVADCTSC